MNAPMNNNPPSWNSSLQFMRVTSENENKFCCFFVNFWELIKVFEKPALTQNKQKILPEGEP